MIPTNSQKRGVETFVVNRASQTLMPNSGSLNDSATGNVNLSNGQFGIVSVSSFGSVALNNFVDGTPTFAEAPVIAIFQGTQYSQNVVGSTATYPLWVRPFEKTQDIDGRNNNIMVTKQAFRAASHNVWVLGNTAGSTSGVVNVADETEYRLNIGFRSRRFDEMLATQVQTANLTISKITPDFTALSYANDDLKRDWIMINFGYEVNRNSTAFLSNNRYRGTSPVVALAVGVANSGPSGAAAGVAISSLTAGTTFAVFTYKGIARSITLTQEMINSLTEASTDSGFTHLFTIDLVNAGSAVGGTATGLFFVALDQKPVYEDYIPQVKVRLQVGLPAGFDFTTVRNLEVVNADEGQGYSRQLDLWYKNTAGQRKYSQKHDTNPVINFPSPIESGVNYTTYIINHGKVSSPDVNSLVYSPKKEVILIPSTNTILESNFDSVMNTWLVSTGNTAIKSI